MILITLFLGYVIIEFELYVQLEMVLNIATHAKEHNGVHKMLATHSQTYYM